MAAYFQRTAQLCMMLQAANNLLFGAVCVLFPAALGEFVGGEYAASPPGVLRAVGLGMYATGVYGLAGAIQNDKRFFWLTAGLRVGFAGVMVATGEGWGVVAYEVVTAGMAVGAAGGVAWWWEEDGKVGEEGGGKDEEDEKECAQCLQ